MYALTVCQPWAWAIMVGPKRVENRTWRTNYRGPLAIHAGKSRKWLRDCDRFPDGTLPPAATDLTFGAVLGVVELVNVLPYTDPEVATDPWADGPWCWVLRDPQPWFEPFYCPGACGLWRIAAQIPSELNLWGSGNIKGTIT